MREPGTSVFAGVENDGRPFAIARLGLRDENAKKLLTMREYDRTVNGCTGHACLPDGQSGA